MKKTVIYLLAMLLCVIAGLLLWEASPAIAERLNSTVKATDWFAYFWAFPGIVFSALFNEESEKRKAL